MTYTVPGMKAVQAAEVVKLRMERPDGSLTTDGASTEREAAERAIAG